MKLFVADADAYLYPDVMVTCDERDRRAELAIEHPRLVVEVLSDSTAAYDRGIKFAAYRKLADLREYLLVDVDQRRLELYRRAAGRWILLESERDGPALRLESVVGAGVVATVTLPRSMEELAPPAEEAR